jgi:hypothetical protein
MYILNNMQVKGIVFIIDKAVVGKDNLAYVQSSRNIISAHQQLIMSESVKKTFNL